MSTLEGSLTSAEVVPVETAIGGDVATSTEGQALGAEGAAVEVIDPQWSPGAQERIRTLIAERDAERARAAEVDTYKPFQKIIDDLRAANINSADEFISRQQAAANAQAEERARTARLQPVAQRLIEKRDAGLLDPEEAEAAWISAQEAERLRDANRSTQSQLTEMQIERLTSQEKYKEADPDYVRALVAGGVAVEAAVAKSHAREVQRGQDVLARYNATKDKDNAQNTPMGGAGGSGVSNGLGAPPDPQKDPAGFDKWWAAQEAAAAKR